MSEGMLLTLCTGTQENFRVFLTLFLFSALLKARFPLKLSHEHSKARAKSRHSGHLSVEAKSTSGAFVNADLMIAQAWKGCIEKHLLPLLNAILQFGYARDGDIPNCSQMLIRYSPEVHPVPATPTASKKESTTTEAGNLLSPCSTHDVPVYSVRYSAQGGHSAVPVIPPQLGQSRLTER